ncbi:MAG: LysR family transcriptional regulator [Pseudomonadota bacterium]
MRLTLDSLIVLDAIERHGSFAAGAEALHRTPSAVTYAVQKLEEDLGILIFDRSGHRAKLTDAGGELLREGRRLLRAADELENRAKRVATGYEVELRIAVDDLIGVERLLPLVSDFYSTEVCGTRVRLSAEVYGGTWDALASQRCDLAIGVPAEGPGGGGYATQPLGEVTWQFVVAPSHPLAVASEPISSAELLQHRAVSVADSSRHLPPRTSGLLTGQDVLSVPSLRAKLAAQAAGLGVGYLPRAMAEAEAKAGRLIIKTVEESRPPQQVFVAWRTADRGKALRWFVQRLADEKVHAALMAGV